MIVMVPRAAAQAQEDQTKIMIEELQWTLVRTKMKVKIQTGELSMRTLCVSLSRGLCTFFIIHRRRPWSARSSSRADAQ